MLTSFALSIQPHPSSEWRDDRAQLQLSLLAPTRLFLTIPKTPGLSTYPFQPARTALWVAFLSCGLAKAQVDLSTSLYHDTVTGLPIWLACLVRTLESHLRALPFCCWWLTTFYTGGNRRCEAAEKSQQTGLTTQEGKHFISFDTAGHIIHTQSSPGGQSLHQCTCLAWVWRVIFLLCLQKSMATQWTASLEGHLSPSTLWIPLPTPCLPFYPQNLYSTIAKDLR